MQEVCVWAFLLFGWVAAALGFLYAIPVGVVHMAEGGGCFRLQVGGPLLICVHLFLS